MKKVLLLSIASALFFISCKKGCTDETALNFDPKAKKIDKSCIYTGRVVFYNYYPGSDVYNDCGGIQVYLNDESLGQIIGFWADEDSVQSCSIYDDTSVMRKERVVYKMLPPGTYSYSANDSCESWTGEVEVLSDQCVTVRVGHDLYVVNDQ